MVVIAAPRSWPSLAVTKVARIHYEIDDDLHRRAKSIAALHGETLKALIEKAIKEYVERAENTENLPGPSTPVAWPTCPRPRLHRRNIGTPACCPSSSAGGPAGTLCRRFLSVS